MVEFEKDTTQKGEGVQNKDILEVLGGKHVGEAFLMEAREGGVSVMDGHTLKFAGDLAQMLRNLQVDGRYHQQLVQIVDLIAGYFNACDQEKRRGASTRGCRSHGQSFIKRVVDSLESGGSKEDSSTTEEDMAIFILREAFPDTYTYLAAQLGYYLYGVLSDIENRIVIKSSTLVESLFDLGEELNSAVALAAVRTLITKAMGHPYGSHINLDRALRLIRQWANEQPDRTSEVKSKIKKELMQAFVQQLPPERIVPLVQKRLAQARNARQTHKEETPQPFDMALDFWMELLVRFPIMSAYEVFRFIDKPDRTEYGEALFNALITDIKRTCGLFGICKDVNRIEGQMELLAIYLNGVRQLLELDTGRGEPSLFLNLEKIDSLGILQSILSDKWYEEYEGLHSSRSSKRGEAKEQSEVDFESLLGLHQQYLENSPETLLKDADARRFSFLAYALEQARRLGQDFSFSSDLVVSWYRMVRTQIKEFEKDKNQEN